MKNLKRKWFPLTLVFAFIFALSSCNEECPSCEEEAKPIDAPEQIVSRKDAKLMYDTYSTRRKPLIESYEDSINRRNGYDSKDKIKQHNKKDNKGNSAMRQAVQVDSFPVTRYVHYDYQTIKDYLTFIEQEAKRKGIEISTLRFYLSNYPENMTIKDAKARQNSIFIMPTITQDKRTFGYFLNEKEQIELLTDDLKVSTTPFRPKAETSKAKASFLPEFESSFTSPNYNFYQGQSYILNKGGGAPPPYTQQ